MFVIKFIGSFLVIISSSLIGYLYGIKYRKRLANLIYLQQCIKLLETEVLYGATPLPDALNNVYKKGNKKFSFIFYKIRENLLKHKNKSLNDCFIEVSKILEEKLYFEGEEIEIFTSLGNILGASSRKDHEKNFQMIQVQLKALENEARIEKEKNEKMYKSLGVLTGLAIVIILL